MKYVYRNGKLVPKQFIGHDRVGLGPYVISDEMPPTEQVDGVYYTSKAKFRAKGREFGLIELGTEKFKPKPRASSDPAFRRARQEAIKLAVEQYKAGYGRY